MKRMFFYNAVKLWNVVNSNRDFVCFSSAKKFRRSYFDLIMCKFTPDTFRIDSFLAYMVTFLVSSFIIFNYFSISILVFRIS